MAGVLQLLLLLRRECFRSEFLNEAIMGNQLMQSPSVMFTFTSNCHLGKTHGHRSRGDTTWEAQSLFSQSVSFVAVPGALSPHHLRLKGLR